MLVLIAIAVLLATGAMLEVIRPLLPELFANLHRENDLRESIRLAQADGVAARKRADALAGAANAVREEAARAQAAHDDIEREMEQRRKVPPVLVFLAGSVDEVAGGAHRAFRATITKKLKHEPEPNQIAIWSRPCFVEAHCFSAAEAKIEAHLQFPAAHGYAVGRFSEIERASEIAAELAAGEAA